ncbi:MAG: hypothetical protein ABEJ79_09085 [Halolamina sp.]
MGSASESGTTGRWLVGLTLFALLIAGAGFGVIWALTYGPFA